MDYMLTDYICFRINKEADDLSFKEGDKYFYIDDYQVMSGIYTIDNKTKELRRVRNIFKNNKKALRVLQVIIYNQSNFDYIDNNKVHHPLIAKKATYYCEGCYFHDNKICDRKIRMIPICNSACRYDKTDIIFVER